MNDISMRTIFTIDLLKGRGIPPRSGPIGIAIAVITAAVPVLIAITITGLFLHNKIVMSLMSREITVLETKTSGLSDAVEFQKAMEQEKAHHSLCLSEVKSTIEKYNQWSPVLTTLVENMPSSVTLAELEVKKTSEKKKVPKKDSPGEMMEINVAVTTMLVKMSDDSLSNNDEAVRIFGDYLRSSPLLGPQLEKVDVSRESAVIEGQDVVYYLLECVFKHRS